MWMTLPIETRVKLIEAFNIKKTGPTEVRDSEILSDGYRLEDLLVINLENMNTFTNKISTSFPEALELTLSKLNKPVEIVSIKEEIKPVENFNYGKKNEK